MKVVDVSDRDAAAWDAVVAASPVGTLYHTYRWRHALQRSYGIETRYLAAVVGDDWQAVLPLAAIAPLGGRRAVISLPFANYGGIACRAEASPAAAMALLDAARSHVRAGGYQYMELKHQDRLEHRSLINKLHYFSLEMPLNPDPEVVWTTSVDAKARNQVRKARKEGLTVTSGPELLPGFVDVYRRHLRDLGTPTHAGRWFTVLHELLGDQHDVILVSHQGRPIAGAWLFFYRDVAILHAAASLSRFNRLCPNNLVYWSAIELACRRGCRLLDFARSRTGSGTFHFKKQWGAEPRQTFYQYVLNTAKRVPDMDPHNPRYSLATRLWKHLPLPVANRVGPLFRPRITT